MAAGALAAEALAAALFNALPDRCGPSLDMRHGCVIRAGRTVGKVHAGRYFRYFGSSSNASPPIPHMGGIMDWPLRLKCGRERTRQKAGLRNFWVIGSVI